MAKQQPPSPQAIPSTEAKDRPPPAERDTLTAVESEPGAFTAPVPHEILAWSEEGTYPAHWGINE